MEDITNLLQGELSVEDVINAFNKINKAECYLHKIKKINQTEYFKLKKESSLLENEPIDVLIYDCVFIEEPKFVRYILQTKDVSNVQSDFEYGMKKLGNTRVKFWREFLKGTTDTDNELYLLYLNYFTLFTGRTRGNVNIPMLENNLYLEGQFLREKELSKLFTFHYGNINNNYSMKVKKTGDFNRIILEKNNRKLEKKISTLLAGGGE